MSWWRHQTEIFSALLALCAGNSPVNGEFPSQRPVTQSFDVSFDLRLNKRPSKQLWGWWFETPSRPLWCHYNVAGILVIQNSWSPMLMQWRYYSLALSHALAYSRKHMHHYHAIHSHCASWDIVLTYVHHSELDNSIVKSVNITVLF